MTDRTLAFPRSARIRKSSEFRKITASSKLIENEGVVLRAAQNGRNHSRLGVVITRQAMKLAARRNRAKRIVREFFRLNQKRLAGHFDLVVKMKRGSLDQRMSSLGKTLERLFLKAGVFRER